MSTKVIRIKNFLGMDSYSDSTMLPDGVFQLLENVRPRRGSLDTREGLTRFVATSLGANSVTGIGTFWADPQTKLLVCAYGGQLYTSPFGSPSWTAIGSANDIAANTQVQIVQSQETLIVVDQVNQARIFRKNQAALEPLGVPDPSDYKMIEDFERVGDWSNTVGVVSLKADYGHFITGIQGIQFSASSSSEVYIHKTFSAQDLTYLKNGSASGVKDFITFYVYVTNFASGAPFIGLESGASNQFYINFGPSISANYASIVNAAYLVYIPKSSFTTIGSPAWNNITGVVVGCNATNGTQAFTLDSLRLQQASIIVTPQTTGVLNGIYSYGVTFVSDTGLESALSVLSYTANSSVIPLSYTASNASLNLSQIPTTNSTRLTQRNVYRIGGSSNAYRVVTALSDPTVTTFVDNIADANLGSVYVSANQNTPYTPKIIFIHNNYVILVNVTDPSGLTYPTGVMVSQQYSFDYYDHISNFFEIEPNQGHSAQWGLSDFGYAYIGLSDSIWQFSPETLSTTSPIALTRAYGGVGAKARCLGENGFYFYSQDNSVVFYNGASFQDISEIGTNKVKNFLLNVPKVYQSTISMEYYDHTLFVFIPQGTDIYPTKVLAFDTIKQQWYVITGLNWAATATYTSDVDSLYIGSPSTGVVYEALTGNDDDGTAIVSQITSSDMDCGMPDILKWTDRIFIFGTLPAGVTTPAKGFVVARLDGSATLPVGDTATGQGFGTDPFGETIFGTDTYSSFTATVNERKDYPVTNAGYQGTTVGFQITLYGRWSLRQITQVVQTLEPTYDVEQ